MTGFMMQRGGQIICGDAGLGSVTRCTTAASTSPAKVRLAGRRLRREEMGPRTTSCSTGSSRIYRMDKPDTFRKFVCGKQLCDTLEALERSSSL
ncbi:hypothetical protein HBB16_15385 [Pseudonocardia sp. MCCB 268]|nr:hypothetical protein [Pseudonocardia cytotoxica]